MEITVNNLRKSYTKMNNGVDYMRNHIEKILHLAHNFIIIISLRKQTIHGDRQLTLKGAGETEVGSRETEIGSRGDRDWEQGDKRWGQGDRRLRAGSIE